MLTLSDVCARILSRPTNVERWKSLANRAGNFDDLSRYGPVFGESRNLSRDSYANRCLPSRPTSPQVAAPVHRVGRRAGLCRGTRRSADRSRQFGPHILAVPEALVAGRFHYDYLVSVNRARSRRTRFEGYPSTVRQPLPQIRIPLAGDDPDVPLDIRAALEQTYDAGSYRDRIDDHSACQPPLSPDDRAWADQLIQAAEQAGSR